MSDYLLGLVTLPVLALLGFTVASAYWIAEIHMERRWGITWESKLRRGVDDISDYTLLNDIWWERKFGPVFTGGWYRDQIGTPKFNRWVGFGSPGGPCFMVFRMHNLGTDADQ